MPVEIYYTSAPAGLKPGSSGFCTVAATEAVPRALLERLEALSAYRHHHPAGANTRSPVAYAHCLLTVGGRQWHVLSRIADAGVDYTQRSNFFAHHLALQPQELPAGGPAALLRAGVLSDAWDGTVRTLPQRAIHGSESGPRPASTWQQLCGDAGWAGVVARQTLDAPQRPLCLLYAENHDVLALVDEALALLPPEARWRVTFNTFFTSLPSSATCAWRCCPAGTAAADSMLRQLPGALVVDLVGGMPAPAAAAHVDAARQGLPIARSASVPAAPARKPAPPQRGRKTKPLPDLEPEPAFEPEIGPADGPEIDLSEFDDFAAQQRRRQRIEALTHAARPEPEPRRAPKSLLLYVLALLALAVGLALLVLSNMVAWDPPRDLPKPPPIINPVTLPSIPTNLAIRTDPPQLATLPALPSTVAVNPDPPPLVPPDPATRIIEPEPLRDIILADLPEPAGGAVLRDRVVTLPLRARLLNGAPAVALVTVFPGDTRVRAWPEPQGEFRQQPTPRGVGFSLTFVATQAAAASSTELALVELDLRQLNLVITWRTAALARQADLVLAAWWMLHQGVLHAVDDKGHVHTIRLSVRGDQTVALADPRSDLKWPCSLPEKARLEAIELPEGWSWRPRDDGGGEMWRAHPLGGDPLVITLAAAPRLAALSSDYAAALAARAGDGEQLRRQADELQLSIDQLNQTAEQDLRTLADRWKDFPRELADILDKRRKMLDEAVREPSDKLAAAKLQLSRLQAAAELLRAVGPVRLHAVLPDGSGVGVVTLTR